MQAAMVGPAPEWRRSFWTRPPDGSEEPGIERLLGSVQCTLLRAGWFRFMPGWQMRRRSVPNYMLWVCVSGGADFAIDGTPRRLDAGVLQIIPPRATMEARGDPSHPVELYTMHFTARLHGVLDMPKMCGLPEMMWPAPRTMTKVVHLIRHSVAELEARAPGFALAANGDCGRILSLLWRETAGTDSYADMGTLAVKATNRADSARVPVAAITRLAPAFHAIQARYSEHVTLKDLSATVHLHPGYFSTLFRQVTGLPPLRYVARYRLERVRELLLSTGLSLSEIAAMTGYRDPFHLSHVFRKAEGISPTHFRKAEQDAGLP